MTKQMLMEMVQDAKAKKNYAKVCQQSRENSPSKLRVER